MDLDSARDRLRRQRGFHTMEERDGDILAMVAQGTPEAAPRKFMKNPLPQRISSSPLYKLKNKHLRGVLILFVHTNEYGHRYSRRVSLKILKGLSQRTPSLPEGGGLGNPNLSHTH